MKNKLISIILIILAIIGIGITTFAFVSPGYQYQLKMNEYSNCLLYTSDAADEL